MSRAADNMQLRGAFAMHLKQTEEHARRIEEIFSAVLAASPKGQRCAALEGLVEEGKDVIDNGGAADAALIRAAQRVEQYEFAGYGTARAHAQQLGYGNSTHRTGHNRLNFRRGWSA